MHSYLLMNKVKRTNYVKEEEIKAKSIDLVILTPRH